MFALNSFTPKCVDDYFYSLKLPEFRVLQNINEIIPTIRLHAQQVNGRLVSHFFAYLFNFLPKPVFNLVNSTVFLFLLLLIYYIICRFEKYDVLLFLFLFCCIWYFEYAFGQVNIWLTGSCNYLWGIVVSLLFVFPFYKLYLGNDMHPNLYNKLLFLIISFLSGAYNEIASSSMIMMSVLFLLVCFLNKRKVNPVYYLSIIIACIGYIIMISAPAERIKVGSNHQFSMLLSYAIKMYAGFHPLLLLWILLFVFLFINRKKQKAYSLLEPCPLLTSIVFMLGSLEANFVLAFASSYSDRCASPTLVYLVVALGILLYEFSKSAKYSRLSVLLIIWIMPLTLYRGVYGTYDIYRTGRDMKENIAMVTDSLMHGETTVSVPYVYACTKYSPVFDLKYLDTENADDWPNYYISYFFGADRIIGEK